MAKHPLLYTPMAIISAIIDSREASWQKECTFGGVPTAVTLLEAGDLLLACDDGAVLVIENKSADDFLNSLRDDRLLAQLVKMRESLPDAWHYLALRGQLQPGPDGLCYADGRKTGWQWASVAGILTSIQEIGIVIYPIASDQEWEAAIIRLGNRERKPIRVRPIRESTVMGDAEAILCALPGIGPEKARALLEYAGTPAWALVYLSNDEWQGPAAPGLGEGTRRRIRKALELPEGQILTVVTQNDEKEVAFKLPERAIR